MFDEVVHTLGSVAYVPKMQKSQISLGRLDSMGCWYSVASEAMKKHTWLLDPDKGR